MDISVIISLALTVIATVAGGFWLKAKGKLKDVKNLLKEGIDIITVAVDALDDNQVSSDEIENLKVQVAEFKAAFKALLNKEV